MNKNKEKDILKHYYVYGVILEKQILYEKNHHYSGSSKMIIPLKPLNVNTNKDWKLKELYRREKY